MFDLKMTFTYPWLLLLIIPLFGVALFLHFRVDKKFRRNRTRITSLVLHLVVSALAVLVLSGIGFDYREYNSGNSILFVVDNSFSSAEQKEARDDYIRDVVSLSNSDVYKIGIVTFGHDTHYTVPMTNDINGILADWKQAPAPSEDATDISAALSYARTLIGKSEAAKIVLISDGVETDNHALAVIRNIAADGIRVDTVCTSALNAENEVQIVETRFPDYHVNEEEEFNIELTVKSGASLADQRDVVINMYDNNEKCDDVTVTLTSGLQTVTVPHTVKGEGLHSFRFVINNTADEITENNSVYSYMLLEKFDSILIIENSANQSHKLLSMLEGYNVSTLNVESDSFPTTLDALRAYDEIILNNIAAGDLEDGFTALLQDYVYTEGGGLFTVGGGENGAPELAHAYNRQDLAGTTLQQMLPVQAIDYTPPLGLSIVIDVSGSMTMEGKLDAAKNSARSIVQDESCLNERDYCAILTLSDSFTEEVRPLPMTRQNEILDAIYGVRSGNNTIFSPAIERASMDLLALKHNGTIDKMHVIIITDGGVSFNDRNYIDLVRAYHEQGVSFSFVAIRAGNADMMELEKAAAAGGGRAINSTVADLTIQLKDDIRVPEIKEVEYGEFTPTINKNSTFASLISQQDMPSLDGFYGTKARVDADVVLYGEYNVPVYAQWKYGAGSVGSFMCDLDGVWSNNLVSSEAGVKLVHGIVDKLMPTQSIRPKQMNVALNEGNFTSQLSIYPATELKSGESMRVTVENLDDLAANPKVVQPVQAESYSRASFTVTTSGVYRVLVEKLNSDGTAVASEEIYRAFSYSSEYDFMDAQKVQDGITLMEQLALYGNGVYANIADADPLKVFEGFVTSFARHYDPRLPLIIIAIILFLLDIAARKFKWKWIHELVREHKQKKAKEGK